MALKDPVVAIAAYQFGAAAVLWFKKRKRWNAEQDLSFLATRIRARCPIHKPLFFSEVSAISQDISGDLVIVLICPILFAFLLSKFYFRCLLVFPLSTARLLTGQKIITKRVLFFAVYISRHVC